MKIKIFDVEHGQCALIEHGDEHVLVDCGHNSMTGWRPSQMLRYRGIDQLDALVITNADEDHASDLPGLVRAATIARLYVNPTITGGDLLKLKGQDCGPGILTLSGLVGGSASALPPPWLDGATIHAFWNGYPYHFEDENNLSLVTIFEWPDFSICFSGDIEAAGWQRLLQDIDFRLVLSRVTVFMASHHGRRDGYYAPLFAETGLEPQLIIISDAGHQFATQETVRDYAQHSRGIELNGHRRMVLTTRHDGKIEFNRQASGWFVSTTRSW